MSAAPTIFRFGRWQLDTQRRTLVAGGASVPLNGRAFDMLALLVARAGEVLTRDEIVSHVWQGLAVGENNLTVQMSTLRRILAEEGETGPIVTVPGRGYRFTGELLPDPPPANAEASAISQGILSTPPFHPASFEPVTSKPKRQRGWASAVIAAAVLALVLGGAAMVMRSLVPSAPRLSIAVLPLRNLSADHAQDYLADALTDDLTTDLAHIPGSTVIAHESAASFGTQAVPVQQIGRALHVRYVVEGSFRVEDSQYHVNAQLVDATTGAHLWASRYDAPQSKMAEMRDAIVRRLATALDFQLTQIEASRSLHDRPDDPDALDLFFRARAILDWDDSLPGLTRAQKMLEEAVVKQPDFADALTALASLLVHKVDAMDDPDSIEDNSALRVVIERALTLAPHSASALAVRAQIFAMDEDCTAATYSAMRATAIDNSNVASEVVLATCAQRDGRLDDALLHFGKVFRLAPESAENRARYVTVAYINLLQNHVQEALDALHRATAGDGKSSATEGMGRSEVTRVLTIAATQMEGNVVAAGAQYNDYAKLWPRRTVWRFGAMISKANSRLPGYSRLLSALHDAGMPWYADERTHEPIIGPRCPGTAYDITPEFVEGAGTLTTDGLVQKLRESRATVILDLGRGSASPASSFWYNADATSESPNEFAARIIGGLGDQRPSPNIVVMSNGVYGCLGFSVTMSLVHNRIAPVFWFRGGEEAWAAAGQPSIDRRIQ